MERLAYTQPQIDVDTQIALLKSENLTFVDEAKAKRLLRHISLFRLKAYLHPLRISGNRHFKTGATFEQAYGLYKFDAAFRKLIWAELEKIEVSVRTQLSFSMTDNAGNFWFADSSNFSNTAKHTGIIASIKNELNRSDDDAILDFFTKYSDPFPPSWMTMEVTSFGSLSMLYRWHNPGKARREVAAFYGVSDTVFESWLHSIVYVRNICGHHGRLWNRTLRIRPKAPKKPRKPFISSLANPQKIYYVLSILLYTLKTVNPNSTFVSRFKSLLAEYPNVDISAMGFPVNWESEPLWL